ncbi:MAG: CHAT domain-containing protein [Candidatus Methanofastidiosia archaeon]|jgi:hypothetical protein
MTVTHEITLSYKKDSIEITQVLPDKSVYTTTLTQKKYSELKELCQFPLDTMDKTRAIGKIIFDVLNGDKKILEKSFKEADAHGVRLTLLVTTDFNTEHVYEPDFPFESLYHPTHSPTPSIHIIRKISDYGHKKPFSPKDHPLKMLFIACSPLDVEPVLKFEKEEETIFDITKELPVDMDVEDTGSLQGLKTACESTEYDIVHITGHANIDENGPYFCMENEEGYKDIVRPHQLWEVLRDSRSLRLIFLSGCRTGENRAAFSFGHQLVESHTPPVIGWGLPVTDPGAREAAEKLYYELGKGKSVLDAVFVARRLLYENNKSDWCLLRIFSDGTNLGIPIVEKGQKKSVKRRELQYMYLERSHVKVLKKGFVGRRRKIQKGVRSLKDKKMWSINSVSILHSIQPFQIFFSNYQFLHIFVNNSCFLKFRSSNSVF